MRLMIDEIISWVRCVPHHVTSSLTHSLTHTFASYTLSILQNLYGEKEWVLISDRFLPDRSAGGAVSHRYLKVCLLIYRGHGVHIDKNGHFDPPRELLNGIKDLDEEEIDSYQLNTVRRPLVMGLHRWTIEEDIMLLKTVPLMGRMYAEIGKRFIPYRDRGALRKRYQTLERRVRGVMKRDKKFFAETSTPLATMNVLNKRKLTTVKLVATTAPVDIAPKKKKPNPTTKTPKAPAKKSISSAPAPSPKKVAAKKTPPPPPSSFETYIEEPPCYFPRTAAVTSNAAGYSSSPSFSQSQGYASSAGDNYSSMALGRVIEGEWSQMKKMSPTANSGEQNSISSSQVSPGASRQALDNDDGYQR